jgi:anti-anti-sigma factor
MPATPPIEPPSYELSSQVLGSEALVVASGELDLQAVPELRDLFSSLASSGCREVVVDASGVTFIDVSGLRALLGGVSRGLTLLLQAPSKPVVRLLQLTATTDALPVVEPEEGRAGWHRPRRG